MDISMLTKRKQKQLNFLIEAIYRCPQHYDDIDWLLNASSHVADTAMKHLSTVKDEPINLAHSLPTCTGILQLTPKYYLRFAMAMDFSIRNGRLPEDNDFPLRFRKALDDNQPAVDFSIEGQTVSTIDLECPMRVAGDFPELHITPQAENIKQAVPSSDIQSYPGAFQEGIGEIPIEFHLSGIEGLAPFDDGLVWYGSCDHSAGGSLDKNLEVSLDDSETPPELGLEADYGLFSTPIPLEFYGV